MFSVLWRGKRTPREKGSTTFISPEYDICGDVTLHMPSTGDLVCRISHHVLGNDLVGNCQPMLSDP